MILKESYDEFQGQSLDKSEIKDRDLNPEKNVDEKAISNSTCCNVIKL